MKTLMTTVYTVDTFSNIMIFKIPSVILKILNKEIVWRIKNKTRNIRKLDAD